MQYRIEEAARQVEEDLNDTDFTYLPKTKKRLQDTVEALDLAYKMLRLVDYYMAGDDGEESFNQRWDEEIFNK